jgi:hypothetical protein
MPAGAANVAESRSYHELGAAAPAGIRELGHWVGGWRAPKLVLYVVNQVSHGKILSLCNATL